MGDRRVEGSTGILPTGAGRLAALPRSRRMAHGRKGKPLSLLTAAHGDEGKGFSLLDAARGNEGKRFSLPTLLRGNEGK